MAPRHRQEVAILMRNSHAPLPLRVRNGERRVHRFVIASAPLGEGPARHTEALAHTARRSRIRPSWVFYARLCPILVHTAPLSRGTDDRAVQSTSQKETPVAVVAIARVGVICCCSFHRCCCRWASYGRRWRRVDDGSRSDRRSSFLLHDIATCRCCGWCSCWC